MTCLTASPLSLLPLTTVFTLMKQKSQKLYNTTHRNCCSHPQPRSPAADRQWIMGTGVPTTRTRTHTHKLTPLSQQNRGSVSSYGVPLSPLSPCFFSTLSSLCVHLSSPFPTCLSLANAFTMTWHLYNNLLFSLQCSNTPEIWSVGFMLCSFHSLCQSTNFLAVFLLAAERDVFTSDPTRAGFPHGGKNNTKNNSPLLWITK